MDAKQQLALLYTRTTRQAPTEIQLLPEAGSNRTYYRLKGSRSLIGVEGTSIAENRAFIHLSRHFVAASLPMPAIKAVSEDERYYLQEDLGDVSLFDAIRNGRETGNFNPDEIALLHQTIQCLPAIQYVGGQRLDFGHCYPQSEFDRRTVMWDLNYFKYCFLKLTGLEFEEHLLEKDFETLAERLLDSDNEPTFLYRDFQSRNVLIKDGKPHFIDFQGGRKGPIYYDVASFLWQAKANLPTSLRESLITSYLEALRTYRIIDRPTFDTHLRLFVFFRTLQVLGAYGFRGWIEKKTHFIESIPFALRNLEATADYFESDFPYLVSILKNIIALPRFQPSAEESKELTVEVMSFSYRKGIPEDISGNGGGYVFDCRSIHNPGRYAPYKALNGMDQPVIDFLENDGEILTFLKHVDALVDFHVETYLKRGFTHLSVYFGCTGGQHRSVYSAQHVAEHLHQKYGVKVVLSHREQGIKQIFR